MRVSTLQSYGIVGSAPHAAFDRIVRMAARIFDVPVAVISLADGDSHWLKAAFGIGHDADCPGALFNATIGQDDVFVAADASADPQLADDANGGARPAIRFFAGAPLVNPHGFKLGSLCIVDWKPRHDFSEQDREILRDLANTVSELIESHFPADRRKTAEALAAAQEARSRTDHIHGVLLKDVPLAVAMFDRSHAFVLATRRWCKTFGIDGKDIKGRYLLDVQPDLPAAWLEQHERCLNGQRFFVEEEELALPGRSPHWFRRTVHPWHDQHGNLGGIIVVMVSLDAQVRARREVHDSRHFIQAILHNVNEGIIACDADGEISLANPASARILGTDPADLSDPGAWRNRIKVYRNGEDKPVPLADFPLARLLRGDEIKAEELRVVNVAKSARQLVIHGAAMREPNGEIMGAVISLHDVTRERAIHRSWREADALYKAVFNAASHYATVIDADFKVVEVNSRAESILQQPREELIGLPMWDDAFWKGCRHEIPRLMDSLRAAASGELVNYEFDYTTPDGTPIPIEYYLTPVLNEAGEVTHIISEGRDITERRAHEEALLRKTAELEMIFNNVPIRIFYKDDRNRIIRLNAPAAASMGLSVAEAEGAETADFFTEHAAEYHERDLEVINSGQPLLGFVEPYAPVNGEAGWVRTDKVPHVDPATGERFLFVASVDITAEREAVEALRESEERYRLLYNQTPVMLQSVGADGRIVSVSDYWLEKLGYSSEDVIGAPAHAFVRGGEQIIFPWQTGTDDPVVDMEIDLLARDGSLITVLLSSVAMRLPIGGQPRWLTSLTDITDRKRMETQLFQASKMESVGQLTGGLAHDFNNLLCIVLGNLQLMERRIGRDERLAPLLNSAIQAVRSGSDLTQRLLAVSRGMPLETTNVDVVKLVGNLHELLQRALGSRFDLRLELETEQAIARSDKAQLEAAVLNLAINARDAMIANGSLTVTVSKVELTREEPELRPGSYVTLSVADTGVGIAPDVMPRVLEPFFTTKSRGKGSGLGLAMIYGFMRQMGGTVRIESEVGKGTVVTLYMPAGTGAAESTPPEQAAALAQADLRGATILVAEDQEEVRSTIVALLSEGGCHPLTASSGPEAFAMLESGVAVDLLLTDIIMPGAYNGVGLARRAKALRPNLPILFATGYAEDAVLEAARMFSDHPDPAKTPARRSPSPEHRAGARRFPGLPADPRDGRGRAQSRDGASLRLARRALRMDGATDRRGRRLHSTKAERWLALLVGRTHTRYVAETFAIKAETRHSTDTVGGASHAVGPSSNEQSGRRSGDRFWSLAMSFVL